LQVPVANRQARGGGTQVHQFLNYQEAFHLSPRPVPDINTPTKVLNNGFALFAVDGNSDFKGTSYAGTIAVIVTDSLRAGVTISANTFDASATATRFNSNFGASYPNPI